MNPDEVGQRRLLVVLGIPAFGIALAYTVVGTYLPVLLVELSGPLVTGVLIGGEGLFALVLPVLLGSWSDATRSRLGSRVPFVVAGTALMIPALVAMPVGAGSVGMLAVALAVFFVGYFVYYTPYYALYHDLVPAHLRGRSQGLQGSMRGAGLLIALAGGGLALSLWRPLPFLIGAVAIVVVTAALLVGLWRPLTSAPRPGRDRSYADGMRADLWLVRRDRSVRAWVIAQALWEGAIAALKTFVVLYLSQGLGLTLSGSAIALALVGMGALAAAPFAGSLADRFGARPVMRVAVWVFALGLIPPLVTTNTAFVAAVLPVAFAAVVLITLPYALLMDLLPRSGRGSGASLFGFARGIGILIGPTLAGSAVLALDELPVGAFAETQGYSAAFGVAMVLLLGSVFPLGRIGSRPAGDEVGYSGRSRG